ncbi:MAG: hypothetical protein IIV62_02810, partial [Anaerotignum sp.]|nr:hypothetical protein [Anaerotignum sp.]
DMYDERRRNGELAAAIEEGMEKGREEGIAEAVRKMMAAGMSVEQVCGIMNLEKDEVKKMSSE